MPSFERRPETVEAVQWDGTAEGAWAIVDMIAPRGYAEMSIRIYADSHNRPILKLNLNKPDQDDQVHEGYWVLKGLYGDARGVHILSNVAFEQYFKPKDEGINVQITSITDA